MADRHSDRASAARLTWTTSGDRATITLSGDIDRPDARRLVVLATAALSSAASLDLDLHDVGIFGSAAADAIARVRALGARAGAPMQLRNVPPHVTRVLQVLDLDPPSATPDPTHDGRLLITSGYAADETIGQTPRILQGPLTDRRTLDRLVTDVRG